MAHLADVLFCDGKKDNDTISVVMGILDNLFGNKSAKTVEPLSRECEIALNTNKYINTLVNIDEYIPKSRYLKTIKSQKNTAEFFSTLFKSGMLEEYCDKYGINQKDIYNFLDTYVNCEKKIDEHNNTFIKNQLNINKNYLDDILKDVDPAIKLDENQRKVVLTDEDYCLVIAGAGAGKTTTVAAKTKYLVEKKNVSPNEILIVSFTNKAVGELREKINKDMNIPCIISTFHSIGNAILKTSSEEKLNIADPDKLFYCIRDYFTKTVLADKSMVSKVVMFFSTYLNAPEGENLEDFLNSLSKTSFTSMKFDFGENVKQIKDLMSKKMVSIQNEVMRSYQEVQIANYLYTNGLDYEYEPIYKYNIKYASKPYTPDFVIRQGDKEVYLEHFGINENGTNFRFTDEELVKYKKAINDKIILHREHGTKLIYTFSSYKDERTLLGHLDEELRKCGFVLKPKSEKEIINKITDSASSKYVYKMINLITRFINNFKTNGYGAEMFDEMSNSTTNVRSKLFLDICKACYLEYEKVLKENNAIDFQDMINKSAKILLDMKNENKKLHFKYVIVDEYQDISRQRFDLVGAIHDVCDAKIVAVGDDWQSIYAFAGSDVKLFTDFENKMGYAQMLKIENTYRNSQEVIDIAGNFIQKNESQIKKNLSSPKHIKDPIIIYTYDPSRKLSNENNKSGVNYNLAVAVERALDDINRFEKEDGKSCKEILLLGRYNFERKHLEDSGLFQMEERGSDVKSLKYPQYKMTFMTAHSSKGLGYDNVVILNGVNGTFGFPSKIEDDPVLKFVVNEDHSYDYAEERRLFYVAMTRTKNRVYCVAPERFPSEFLLEIKKDYEKVVLKGEWDDTPVTKTYQNKCPLCGYPLMYKSNSQGLRLNICKNDPEICGFMSNNLIGGKMQIMKCDSCKDGFLVVKKANKEPFLGCTNYKPDGTGCNKTIDQSKYYEMMSFTPEGPIEVKTHNPANKDFTIVPDKDFNNGEIKKSIKKDEKLEKLGETCQTILSCVNNVSQKQFYGVEKTIKILRGNANQDKYMIKLDEIPEFGLLGIHRAEELKAIIEWLIEKKYLIQTKDKYPVLHVGINGLEFKKKVTTGQLKELQAKISGQQQNKDVA